MTSQFVIWDQQYYEGFCVISNPQGFKKQYLLLEGVPLAEIWPDTVLCKMSPRYPRDIELSDNLYGGNYPVISKRLREALEASSAGTKMEYLPVTVVNHKGRVASKDYSLVNPLDVVDCIDADRSGIKWNALDENDISSCDRLVLRDDKVAPSISVFRPRFMLSAYLMRRSVADRLTGTGFTGLSFTEPEEYRG